MTIASAFNDIVTAQGGTPSTDGTITGALDALNDTLSGSDQERAETIEDAVRMLGSFIGGGSQYGALHTLRCSVLGEETEFYINVGSLDDPIFWTHSRMCGVREGMRIFAEPNGETVLTANSKLTIHTSGGNYTIDSTMVEGGYYIFEFTMPQSEQEVDINVSAI